MRQHLYFHAKNLNVPAEMYAESHDWNGRGHTDHGLQTSHYHWKTRMHEERRSLGSGDSDADSGRESEFDALADSGENLESDLARHSVGDSEKDSVADSATSQSDDSAAENTSERLLKKDLDHMRRMPSDSKLSNEATLSWQDGDVRWIFSWDDCDVRKALMVT